MREHAAHERADPPPPDLSDSLARALATERVLAWMAWPREHRGAPSTAPPLGYASLTWDFSTFTGRPFAHLDCLYVRDGHRGRHIGRCLLQAVTDHARGAGAEQVQWQTPAWNGDARRFYDRQGATAQEKARYSLRLRPGTAASVTDGPRSARHS